MTIAYIDPLKSAWIRMRKDLFQPFDIVKWLAVGFTAFLAQMFSGHSGGSFNVPSGRKTDIDLEKIVDIPQAVLRWVYENTFWVAIILVVVFIVIIVSVALVWVSSRGKFMFLDNVVHTRAEIIAPWHRYEILGNSLFLWRICFGFLCLALVLAMVVACFGFLISYFSQSLSLPGLVVSLAGILLVFMVMMVASGFISVLTDNFIIPIMYKDEVSVLKAWRSFLPLLTKHLLDFFVYGLFYFALVFVVGIGIMLIGCITCCIGFLLLSIPYVGAVIMLPITYLQRCFSVEFLKQFGPGFSLFPDEEQMSPQMPPSPSRESHGGMV